jgi:hypothetical protein
MRPRRIRRPSLNQIVGIATCAVAATPMILLMVVVNDLLRGKSLSSSMAPLWSIPLLDFLLGYTLTSLFTLPSIVAIGIGAHVLAARKHDTFIVSTACGAVIGYVALSITFELTIGGASTFDFQDYSDVKDAVLLLLLSVMISGLYWLIAVRRDRVRRQIAEEHERALRAME